MACPVDGANDREWVTNGHLSVVYSANRAMSACEGRRSEGVTDVRLESSFERNTNSEPSDYGVGPEKNANQYADWRTQIPTPTAPMSVSLPAHGWRSNIAQRHCSPTTIRP